MMKVFKKIIYTSVFILVMVGALFVYSNYKQECYSRIGRDTVLYINNGKFQLMKGYHTKDLVYFNPEGYDSTILIDVIAWKQTFRGTFLYSNKGYAVINKKGCKLYKPVNTEIVEEAEKEEMLISELSKFYPDIMLISSFDDFSDGEKEIFNNLKEQKN